VAEGADLVDVGGESTRPGAQRVEEAEEIRRVLPVVRALANAGVAVSIDTMRARVAAEALAAGAVLVNDVSGGLADEDMARVVAESSAPYVAMHWRGHSAGMAALAHYDDVVTDVTAELRARLDALVAAGVDEQRVVLDPGLGFAKDAGHNWALLAALDHLARLGRPLLVGASRKGFLGALLADTDGQPRPVEERDVATAVISALVADRDDVWAVRVHAARPTADALRVVRALRSARLDAVSGQ
jgi:dihydropteroate synthase